jgi:hypothetical protein
MHRAVKSILKNIWIPLFFQGLSLAYFTISAVQFVSPFVWTLGLALYVLVSSIALMLMVKREMRNMSNSFFLFEQEHFCIQTSTKNNFVLRYSYLTELKEKKSGLYVYTHNHCKFIPRETESFERIKQWLAEKVAENKFQTEK